MPRHHHVNLGVTPGGLAAQRAFLVDVLGYRPVDLTDEQRAVGVNWFEGEDGSQVHLSEDPDHNAPKRAHVAVQYSDEDLALVEKRLEAAGISVREFDNPDVRRFLVLKDPAGNRWEVRSIS